MSSSTSELTGVNPRAAGVDVMSGDKDEMPRELLLGQPHHKHANGLKNSE